MINVFQPSLGAEELEAVDRVFRSNWVGKGAVTAQFEECFSAHIGVRRGRVRTVNSCTEGLFQTMSVLQIGPGDEVILPSISFVGAANAIAGAGATPVFCDVNPRTLNAEAEQIAAKITAKTKAAIILHYGGVPAPIEDIRTLLEEHKILLIEDSACSVASSVNGIACGTWGDIGLWSFDAMKILVTCDGGMIYCRNEELAHRLDALLYLGLTQPNGLASELSTRWWEFDVSCIARRSIMNDVGSAIGIEQLRKLPAFIERRRAVHEAYDRELGGLAWMRTPPPISLCARGSYYLYWIQTDSEIRDRLATHLRNQGIYTTFRYLPLHRIPIYGCTSPLPNAELAAATTLCLPIHQALDHDEIAVVVESVCSFGKLQRL